MAKILIIDDDENICYALSRLARQMDHEADCAATLKEGLEKANYEDVDVVFLDVQMPDGSGLDVLPQLQASSGEPEVIISTGYGDANGAELAIKSGAWDYIEKSSSAKAIRLSLSRALQYRKEKKTAAVANTVMALRRKNIIGDSPQIRACLDMVAQAALSDINVLITGETGTGKELFAQAIHNNSARANGSFVVEWSRLPHYKPEILGLQTFQLVLQDPAQHPTGSGDGELLFYYRQVNNNDHLRMYATVGIESPDGSDGLQVVFNAAYAQGMAGPGAGVWLCLWP